MTIEQQRTDLLCIAATIMQASNPIMDAIIAEGEADGTPQSRTLADLAALMKKVKRRVEIIEINFELRNQHHKAHRHDSNTPTTA